MFYQFLPPILSKNQLCQHRNLPQLKPFVKGWGWQPASIDPTDEAHPSTKISLGVVLMLARSPLFLATPYFPYESYFSMFRSVWNPHIHHETIYIYISIYLQISSKNILTFYKKQQLYIEINRHEKNIKSYTHIYFC